MHALDAGAIFADRYRIVRCMAAGGMGAVYEVVHIETERRRALKVMHAHFVQSAELRDRFKREARVAAQIESEFIVDVFDAGVDEATQMPFLVMELLKGEELGKLLQRVGRLRPQDAVTYLWQTALALDKTHRVNIVHRDLKPENIFLTEREGAAPSVKVLDFGVAKFVAETGTSGATRSLGTPLYMSPEQFRSQRVSPASDVFALALMAYTLLVGKAYWAPEAEGNDDIIAFALATISGPREPPTARAARLGVTLPPAFDAWFFEACAADPARRPPTATACIKALGDVFGLDPSRLTGISSSAPALHDLAKNANAATRTPTPSAIPDLAGGTMAVPLSTSASSFAGMPVIGAAPPPSALNTAPALSVTGPVAARSRALPFALVGVALLVAVGLVAFLFGRGAGSPSARQPEAPSSASAGVYPSADAPSASASTAPSPPAPPSVSVAASSSPSARAPTAEEPKAPPTHFAPGHRAAPSSKTPRAGYSQD